MKTRLTIRSVLITMGFILFLGFTARATNNDTISSFPYSENWDSFSSGPIFPSGLSNGWYCNTNYPTYGPQWKVNSGGTPSPGTGPSADHTLGTSSGKYIFMESSGTHFGDSSILYSPFLDFSGMTAVQFQFHYHMFGADMGTMRIEQYLSNSWVSVWSISGQQHNSTTALWSKIAVSVNPAATQLRIVGNSILGATAAYTSDMAIDDIRIFQTPSNDMAMIEWVNPQNSYSPDTAMTIKVRIQNQGAIAQDSFLVKYSIDAGTTIVSEVLLDTIQPGDTMVYTFSTKANMGTQGHYFCGAVIQNTGDTLNLNDSLFTDLWIGNPLNGNYTVGYGSGFDYNSISDAASALKNYGMTGAVTFLLDDTTFNEQVIIDGPIQGLSSTNTITFKGQGPNTIVTAAPSSSNRDVFRIDHVNYVTLDSITIAATGSTYNCGVRVMNSDSVTIQYCTINIPTTITSSYSNGILVTGSATSLSTQSSAEYLKLDSNIINGGYYGIKINGLYSSFPKDVHITRNHFNNFYYIGVYIVYLDSVSIIKNVLSSRTGSSGYGFYITSIKGGSKISSNNIVLNTTSSGNGLRIYNSTANSANNPIEISNNMITIPFATGSPYGIYSYYGKYINYFYNTIRIGAGGNSSRGFYVYGSTSSSTYGDIKIKNNIISNYGTGYTFYFNGTYFPSKVTECDYNNLYTNGNYLAHYGSDKADLTAWKASVTNLGANSLSVDPKFTSGIDLHVNSIAMSNSGTPITGITTDFDGDTRNTTTPDIGADEYTPPANELAIIKYLGTSSGCGLTNSETVKVVVVNNGTINQTNIPIKFSVDGGATTTEFIPSINSAAIDTFTFNSNSNLSSSGFHNITVYLDMTIDEDRNNDTLQTEILSVETINSFPFVENFDSNTTFFNPIYNTESMAGISSRAAKEGASGLLLTGGTSDNWNWPYYTVSYAFENSPSHIAKASACNVDATGINNLSMQFDMKMNRTTSSSSWFRVLINDSIYLMDIHGDSAWTALSTNGDSFQTLIFDLSNFANSQFSISLEAACKFSEANYYSNFGDEVFIDNFNLRVPANNDVGILAVLEPTSSICGDTDDSVWVSIFNFGLDTQYTTPVKVDVTSPNGTMSSITATCTDTLAPNNSVIFKVGAINTVSPGNYSIVAYTQLSTDATYNSNDTVGSDFTIESTLGLPFVQDFEAGTNTYYSGDGSRNYDAYSGSYVWKNFMYKTYINKTFTIDKKIGAIDSSSYFVFDFKSAYNTTATTMNGDNVLVLISADCGVNYDTLLVVDSSNHATSNQFQRYMLPLTNYVGSDVLLKFVSSRDASTTQSYTYFHFDNIAIINPPMVNIGPDTSYCSGDIAMLDAGFFASADYIWTRGLDTVGYTQTINVTISGTYIAHVNHFGLMADDAINIVFNATPMVSFTGLNSTYCNDEMASMLLPTPAGGMFTGNGINGNMFDPSAAGVGNHIVTYTLTTIAGCTSMATDTTDVFEAPIVALTNVTICEGDSVMFSAGVAAPATPGLIFSMYIEGSSNNKALEVYNATMDTLSLDNYSIMTNYNGNAWSGQYHFPTSYMLAPGDVFVIGNAAADSLILAVTDDTLAYNEGGYVVGFNGDDVRALYKHSATDSMMIDIIGRYDMVDPGSGWDVAGVSNATKDHSLIRKSTIVGGNTDWDAIAGTDSVSSEYIVYPKNTFMYLGSHSAAALTPVSYTYLWSTGDTTATIKVAPSTTTSYSVSVDNGNCQNFDSAIVTVNAIPMVNLGNDTTVKWTYGVVTLDAGNAGATYTWSTGDVYQKVTFTNANLNYSAPNVISVLVDMYGCSASDTVVITADKDVSINESMANMNIEVYPNPTKGRFNITINGFEGNLEMTIVDLAGQIVHSEKFNVTNNYTKQFDMSTLASGVYYIKLISNGGVKVSKLVIR